MRLAAVVRDEEKGIERMIRSALPLVDSWCIVDTGSEDRTMELIRKATEGIPGELHEREWRNEAHNRTELLQIAQRGADYLLQLDGDDEVMVHGEMPELLMDAYTIRYEGNMEWRLPRIIRADLPWRYEGVCHAYLECDRRTSEAPTDAISLLHHYDDKGERTAKRWRNVKLLEEQVKEHPDDTRSWFYLGQEYKDVDEHQKAYTAYMKRARMGGWAEESFYALYQAGILSQSEQLLLQAWNDRPSRAEPLYWLARFARERGDHATARLYATAGLGVPYPKDSLFVHKWIYEVGFQQELDAL